MMTSIIGALLLFSAMGVLFLVFAGILEVVNAIFKDKVNNTLSNLFTEDENNGD